ncbi:efflux RND transporter permease subunit [Alkalitalea saponilacus]|uniref:Multidrug efflux pump n=1 Tax=Alkalitalea saponilacus TaxID=889453 RepID=A0A1T5HS16_9BACT|nr:efflux RND transporter permease subunit [Alkalitalea saponilacus]ASB50022.1 acriflavin resistance protein [Alkalitalea saponilacus]SKC23465.1 multidrug efflux pump [Alkalitalea saponilacus]
MSLSSLSIRRPVLAIVMSLFIVIIGIIGFGYLGVRDFPSVDQPIVTVSTRFVGANADVIETQITEPLEQAVNGIPGIRSITSSSRDGSSNITVEFNLEVDLETAANDVRDKVSGAMRRLPPDADPPTVSKADADAQPIFSITIRSDSRSLIDLTEFAEVNFKERLQTIPGVSDVLTWGAKRFAIRLWMDPAKLAAYGLTPVDVRNALSRENIELPSGSIEGDNIELTVRTMGRFTSLDDFNRMVVFQDGDRVVRFGDLGRAVVEAQNMRSILKMNGVPMVNNVLVPQPGANYISIVDEALVRLEEIRRDLPSDIIAEVGFDNTQYIRDSISEVQQTIYIAFILVVLIIFLFLRDWRTTLIPAIAIPVSLIGSFFIMYAAGFTINILTLLAIVLAIGLVVDDAIVVMENIYTKIEKGMDPHEAGVQGAAEIFFAVIATSITLVAVFFPIVFLQGVTGRLFREFSIVIAGAVVISSFVALTLTPMLSTKILKKRDKGHNVFYRSTEPFFNWLTEAYRSSLETFMRRWWLTPLIMGIAILAIWRLWVNIPSEMAPLEDRSQLRINATAPEGATFDYTLRYTDELADLIREEVPEAQNIFQIVGIWNNNAAFFSVTLDDPDDRDRTQQEIADDLGERIRGLTGARSFVTQQQTFGGRRGGLPVQYVLQAQNLEKLKEFLPLFMNEVSQSEYFQNYDVNLKFTKPELRIIIDREKAAMLGVSVQDIAQTLQLTFSGQRLGYYIMNGKQYYIIGELERENRNQPADIASLFVRNRTGELIQLDNLVTMEFSSTPPQLFRYNRFVSATVSAGLARGYTLSEGLEEMDRIAGLVLDDTFSTELAGDSRDFVESTSSLLFAFMLALILIYLVLSAQFESFRDPLIIMFSVPFALLGALVSLWYFGQTLNIFSQIGIIMLIGLVSKNGILMVEFANQRKAAGLSINDAIREAAAARFRPILMTSASTILGVLPMALALGAGAESRVSMGIAVIGGLVLASFLTLFVVPVIYSFVSEKTKAVSNVSEAA